MRLLVKTPLYLSLLGTKGLVKSRNLAGSSSEFFKVGGKRSTCELNYSGGSSRWLRILSGYLREAIILSIWAFFCSCVISFWYRSISNRIDFRTFSLKFSSLTSSTSLLFGETCGYCCKFEDYILLTLLFNSDMCLCWYASLLFVVWLIILFTRLVLYEGNLYWRVGCYLGEIGVDITSLDIMIAF